MQKAMAKTADVVVVGGGVMGCSIMYNLAELGTTNTVLLEKDGLGCGSTGRSQAILRMHYSNEVTTRMAWESLNVFKDFERIVGGPSGYVRTGYALIAGQRDRPALEANVAMQKRLCVPTAVLRPEELRRLAPSMSMAGDEVFAYEPESGYADPHLVTQGYARRAREMGARIEMDTQATSVEQRSARVTGVVTTKGMISTRVTVVAAGPWSRGFMRGLGVDLPLETVRHQVIAMGRPVSSRPDHPTFGDLVHSLSARPEGGSLTLVGVGENESAAPEGFDQGVDLAVVEDVVSKLNKRMPGMRNAKFRGGWSGLFTTTPDWHPILDRVQGVEGLYCAVGFSGHGFKLSPMVGLAMAEMIAQGRASTVDVSELGMARFTEGRQLRSRYGMSVLA
jgi:glycine/D-amino acid oxidase-like deaminating enzyme